MGGRGHLERIKPAICRVVSRDFPDCSAGTGFLASPRHVVTCAHVVGKLGKKPGDTLQIRFLDG